MARVARSLQVRTNAYTWKYFEVKGPGERASARMLCHGALENPWT